MSGKEDWEEEIETKEEKKEEKKEEPKKGKKEEKKDEDEEEDWEAETEKKKKAKEDKGKSSKAKEKEKKEEKKRGKMEKIEKIEEKKSKKVKKEEKEEKVEKKEVKLLQMYVNYNKAVSELTTVEEYYGDNLEGDNDTSSIHVEMLEPKTETEFNEYARVLGKMITRFGESKLYEDFVKNLMENISTPLDKMQKIELAKHMTAITEQTKIKKNLTKKDREELNLGTSSSKGAGGNTSKDLLEKVFVDDEDGNNDDEKFDTGDFM